MTERVPTEILLSLAPAFPQFHNGAAFRGFLVVAFTESHLVVGDAYCYPATMSDTSSDSSQARVPLRRAVCGRCKASNWIPGDLPPLKTVPCAKCEHPVILTFRIRQFELREIVASGGMGTVYRSFDVNLNRQVAVKLMKPEMKEDPQVVEGFYREARVGASLNHTNIIHIYTFDEYEGQPYLVMELADHGSLDSRIEQMGVVTELKVLDYGIKVASALDTALKKNLLHRDIKPGNILFNEDDEPKLVDFGLARGTEDEEQGADVWGTPYYVAPEKIKRESETFLSDLYSLGGTLYHALTGHVPFEAETIQDVVLAHVHTPLTPPHAVNPAITQPTSEAISISMAKEPAHRYQSYAQFIMAMEAARSHILVEQMRRGQVQDDEPGGSAASSRSWWKR